MGVSGGAVDYPVAGSTQQCTGWRPLLDGWQQPQHAWSYMCRYATNAGPFDMANGKCDGGVFISDGKVRRHL